MIESPVTYRLRFIGGLRFEKTRIDVVTEDPTYAPGRLDNDDLLPSGSLIYQLNDRTNLRTAYGRTLARPTFRELAPFPSWDFANGYFFIGNPDLKRTLIDNIDLRLEWFSSPGEILAASIFAKRFRNPIERAIKNDNGEIQYQNVNESYVYGLELEFRQKLDMLHGYLADFLLGGNFSLIKSRVDIPESELTVIRTYDPSADGTRPLQGQSPYLLNLDLTYDNVNSNTMVSLSFNVFGERLSEVSLGGTPDVYELPRPDLDLVLGQKVLGGLEFKFSAKNILDSSVKKVHHFKNRDYIYQAYNQGRTFLVGLSYNIG
jgi:TonB-dependent receptor